MSDESDRPDAVLIPEHWKHSNNGDSRPLALVKHAERLLGVDYEGGERAYVRDNAHKDRGDSLRFVTRHFRDCMFFPKSHSRGGQPMYRWEKQADGSALGYLIDDEAVQALEVERAKP